MLPSAELAHPDPVVVHQRQRGARLELRLVPLAGEVQRPRQRQVGPRQLAERGAVGGPSRSTCVRSVTASLVRPARLRSMPAHGQQLGVAGETSDAGAASRSSRRASPAGAPSLHRDAEGERPPHVLVGADVVQRRRSASAASAAATTSSPRPCSVPQEGEVAEGVGVDPRRAGQAGHAAEPAFGAGRVGVGERRACRGRGRAAPSRRTARPAATATSARLVCPSMRSSRTPSSSRSSDRSRDELTVEAHDR